MVLYTTNDSLVVLVSDLMEEGDTYIAAKGGSGGLGNRHFVSGANRSPRKLYISP